MGMIWHALKDVPFASRRIAKPQAGKENRRSVACGFAVGCAINSYRSAPLVIAHHLIWTAYGWWQPNNPRGSMSRNIACDVLAELGQLHHGRKRVQPSSRENSSTVQGTSSSSSGLLLEKVDVTFSSLTFSSLVTFSSPKFERVAA